MIKKYTQYIKENKHFEVNPYGEDDWDEDNLSPILQIARKTGKPYDQIDVLNCSYKQLTSLEGIENLINLRKLYCQNNQLTSLDGIENLINLEILFCQDNQFSKEYKWHRKFSKFRIFILL